MASIPQPRRSRSRHPATALLLAACLPAQSLVRDLTPPPGSPASSFPGIAAAIGSLGFFAATDEFGSELWRSDSTPAGTHLVEDIAVLDPQGALLGGLSLSDGMRLRPGC
jgi:ELWxxDGT repeat protein